MEDQTAATQTLAMGPVASQLAIKMLGTNGGGFFNANSAHPFENPTRGHELPADAVDPPDPDRAVLRARPHGGRPAAGLGRARRDDLVFVVAVVAATVAEQQGNPVLASLGADHAGQCHAGRRQHGRQGSALRHQRLDALRHHHHGRELRRRELDARQLHAAGRRGAAGDDPAGRGDLRRCRLGPVRHAGVRDHGGVHRRPDDRPHARVPGQEDRGPRDEDGVHRHSRGARCWFCWAPPPRC